jgi:hypothetical protein
MVSKVTGAYIEGSVAQWRDLNDKDTLAKQRGTLVGRYITHEYQDGQAVYRITGRSGKSVVIEVVDIDDGLVLPAWGRKCKIPALKAQQLIDKREWLARSLTSNDNWWRERKIGETIHYHNGFDCWVRGVVVDDQGEKKMRPTQLVGAWRQHDLWTRLSDGSIRLGYYAQMIADQTLFTPNASNMFENHWNQPGDDPTSMEPIDIAPPDMTEAEANLAQLMRVRQDVLDALNPSLPSDKRLAAAIMKDALIAARLLLASIPGSDT